MQVSTLKASDRIILAQAIQAKQVVNRTTKAPNFSPYPWQHAYYHAAHDNKQRLLLAANRVGKTAAAAYELACHLTGLYPPDWEGIRFSSPTRCWALGVSGEQIRDVLQSHIFGKYINHDGVKFDGAGWIPDELVRSVVPYLGVGRLAKDVSIKHVSGGASTLSFKSYSQGQHILMGNEIDFILIDEEPEDPEIYPQCLVRTLTGNNGKGGYVSLAMTPENGVTELVGQFMDNRQPGQYLCNVTWDDAPHLDADARAQLLLSIPEYQRDMRTKGIPLMGTGMVYQIAEERLKVDPFVIPSYYRKLVGIDFGIDHPFAAVWGAYDTEHDIIYVTRTYLESGVTPPIHCAAIKAGGRDIPVTYPHDGDNTEKGTGDSLISLYEDELNIIGKYGLQATGNKVEPGIMDLYDRMQTGRFKVFSTCSEWFKEFRRYHRKAGKIVKIDDDLMDGTRYMAGMIIDYGEQEGGSGWGGSADVVNRLNRAAG